MRKFCGANWKMNMDQISIPSFCNQMLNAPVKHEDIDTVIFPPSIYIRLVAKNMKDSKFFIGGQNMYFESNGAFTGEVSPKMLIEARCSFVIIGHSERRHKFGESNDLLKKKVLAAVTAGLFPVYCVGETLEERKAGKAQTVVEEQLKVVDGIRMPLATVVAYEPVWAIGTGVNAQPSDVAEMHGFIRGKIGDAARIAYGGSVTDKNCKELACVANVDGFLVGGASLRADSFTAIVKSLED